jgi:hypothetical protein
VALQLLNDRVRYDPRKGLSKQIVCKFKRVDPNVDLVRGVVHRK